MVIAVIVRLSLQTYYGIMLLNYGPHLDQNQVLLCLAALDTLRLAV